MARSKKYKPADVCRELSIQPYVLRYWETEFVTLRERRSGTNFDESDVAIARRIKELLYDEGYTIAGAKKKLQAEVAADAKSGAKGPQQATLVEEEDVPGESEEAPPDPEGDSSAEPARDGEEAEDAEVSADAPADVVDGEGEAREAVEESEVVDADADPSGEAVEPEVPEEPAEPDADDDRPVDEGAAAETVKEGGGSTNRDNEGDEHDAEAEEERSERLLRMTSGLRALREQASDLLDELRSRE